jgi:hypothetical protein
VTLPRSKVESLARSLRRLAIVLLVVWVVAAIAAIAWVEDEFDGSASAYRYVTAVADVGTFLIAAVLAYVGSALVQVIGRVRSSIISAMFEADQAREVAALDQSQLLEEADQPLEWRSY